MFTLFLRLAVMDFVDRVLVLGAGYRVGFSNPGVFLVVVAYPYFFVTNYTINGVRECDVGIHWFGLLGVGVIVAIRDSVVTVLRAALCR